MNNYEHSIMNAAVIVFVQYWWMENAVGVGGWASAFMIFSHGILVQ